MSNNNANNHASSRKSILVISISQHLTGSPVENAIKADWAKEKAHGIADSFDNIGFNLDPKDVPATLKALKHELERRSWDGIILGWCIRGHVEFTLLFEEVHSVCCEAVKVAPRTKIMFTTGPDNLVETVVRNFPVEVGV
ncbi:hypothetical protein LAWI1_G007537 [Lachnellula willkommii]|uniref:Uncharacterized protein n=1 Tax=Lachnellula willkommii TaxID=215461 RepID=A0A559M565_9HELO|nr:hypothetical protein LAWI1_G007537 [Lachnellula willkommii]